MKDFSAYKYFHYICHLTFNRTSKAVRGIWMEIILDFNLTLVLHVPYARRKDQKKENNFLGYIWKAGADFGQKLTSIPWNNFYTGICAYVWRAHNTLCRACMLFCCEQSEALFHVWRSQWQPFRAFIKRASALFIHSHHNALFACLAQKTQLP